MLATKGRFPMGDGPNDLGLSRRHLRRALDDSLRRLGVDHVDLYQVHAWDAVTPLEETLRFLDDAVTRGQDLLLRLLQLPRLAGHQGGPHGAGARLDGPGDAAAAVQPARPRHRARGRPGLPRRRARPAAVVAAGRWLAHRQVPARQHADGPVAPRRGPRARHGGVGSAQRARSAPGPSSTRSVEVAQAQGVTPAQVALAWVGAQPAVTSVILGARTVEQLRDNLAAADLDLDAEHLERLTEVSTPRMDDYPYGPAGVDQRDRKLTGGR